VMPNASRVLRYWGFDFQKANPSVLRQVKLLVQVLVSNMA
jgi:hypothetical protein